VRAQPSTADVPVRTLDLRTFAAEIENLAASLESSTERDASLVRAGLPDRWHVGEGSERFDVSSGWLVQALPAEPGSITDWPARRNRISRRLRLLSTEAAALAEMPSGRPFGAARTALETVLARREFQQSAASAWRRWIEQRIRDLLTAFGGLLGLSPGSGRRTAVVLAWFAGLAALGGLVVWLIRSLAQQNRTLGLSLDSAAERRESARQWGMRALTAMQNGDVREAVRCAYNACLRRFEEQGVWRVDPARTAREYLRLLPSRHERREAVTDLVRQFEHVWYGNQPLTPDAATRMTEHLEGLGCLPARERAI
jgi:hypothetical protein